VLRRTYFMAMIDGEFCLRMSAVHRPKKQVFGRHAWAEWSSYRQL